MIELIVENKVRLDIDQNTEIETVFDVKDFNIETRNTNFTKSFTLPGTPKNIEFFAYNYTARNIASGLLLRDSMLSGVNTPRKVKLFVNGRIIIEGVLKLDSIEVDKYTNNPIYNVTIEDQFYNILSSIGDFKIVGNADKNNDVNINNLLATRNLYTRTDMISSWSSTVDTCPYVYTFANYGYGWFDLNDWVRISPSYGWYTPKQDTLGVFPSLYAKALFDAIFVKIGLKYESKFLNSDIFKKLIIINPVNKTVVTEAGQQLFYSEQELDYNMTGFGGIVTYDLDWDFNPTPPTPPLMSGTIFTAPTLNSIGDTYTFNVSGYVECNEQTYMNITFYYRVNSTSPWIAFFSGKLNNIVGEKIGFNFTASRVLLQGYQVKFTIGSYPFGTVTDTDATISLGAINVTSSKRGIALENLVPIELTIKDYISTIFKMFNLVIFYKDGNLNLEPYDEFYKINEGKILDLNDNLVDKTSFSLEPLIDLLPKSIKFKGEVGEDDLSVKFESIFDAAYGDASLNVNGNSDDRVIEVNSVLSQYYKVDVDKGPLIPLCYKYDNGEYKGINPGLRFAYYNGLQSFGTNYRIDDFTYSSFPTISPFLDNLTPNSNSIRFGQFISNSKFDYNTTGGISSSNGLFYNYYTNELLTYDIGAYQLTVKTKLKFDTDFDMSILVYLNINGIPNYWRIQRITQSSNPDILTELILIPINITGPNFNLKNVEADKLVTFDLSRGNGAGEFNISLSSNTQFTGNGNNSDYGNFIRVIGDLNSIKANTKNVDINGNNNTIGENTKNVYVLGDNNNLPDNEDGAIWINGERINPYKKTVIIEQADMVNLHSVPYLLIHQVSGYYTDIIDAYAQIFYDVPSPSSYGNVKLIIKYTSDASDKQLQYIDNKLLESTTTQIHKAVPHFDLNLKTDDIEIIAKNALSGSGNGKLKVELYYRLIPV